MEHKVLTTVYAEKMDRAMPLSDYPRPSLKRDSYICLNGEWDYATSDKGTPKEYKQKILVPFPPESHLSGVESEIPDGHRMYYRRTFNLPSGFVQGKVILHFGAVDTICDVSVNGHTVCHHEGGYIPFSADITDAVSSGENELCVAVTDDLDLAYPYGKQTKRRGGMWYTPVSGIWQTVWLESVPNNHIESLKITPCTTSVRIEVRGAVGKKKLTLFDSGEVYEFDSDEITLQMENGELWSPENPKLYYFTLECGEDAVESYFALREISVKEVSGIPRLCLNGEPYLFNGLLDQGYFPDGLFLPATYDGYRDDILTSKRLGFNMLRKHIKIEPEIFYYLCDKLGMAVFQDMVNNSTYSFLLDTALPTIGFKRLPGMRRHSNERTRKIFREHMHETQRHLYNFPSVVYYTVFNEGWGQFNADETYKEAKESDPTRIYDATSGWFLRRDSDVDSRHVYFKPIKLGKVSSRPIVISEFGGYSHRVTGHLFGEGNYGYKSFETVEDFEDAFVRLYEDEIEPLVPLGISALVYTQVSDVEDETNGILTYDRRVCKLKANKLLPIMERIKSKI